MAKLNVTPPAKADIGDILDHLGGVAGPAVADNMNADIINAFDQLIRFPRIGAARPKLGPAVRIWTVGPYVIYDRFDADNDVVRILRLVHGKRNVTRKLLPVESP